MERFRKSVFRGLSYNNFPRVRFPKRQTMQMLCMKRARFCAYGLRYSMSVFVISDHFCNSQPGRKDQNAKESKRRFYNIHYHSERAFRATALFVTWCVCSYAIVDLDVRCACNEGRVVLIISDGHMESEGGCNTEIPNSVLFPYSSSGKVVAAMLSSVLLSREVLFWALSLADHSFCLQSPEFKCCCQSVPIKIRFSNSYRYRLARSKYDPWVVFCQ